MYFNNIVRAVTKQPDGKILVGGDFTQYLNRNYNRIIRLNNDLTIDNTFNVGLGFNNTVNSITLEDNTILAGGTFDLYNNIPVKNLARLDFNGNLIGAPVVSSSSSSSTPVSSSSSSSGQVSSSSSSSGQVSSSSSSSGPVESSSSSSSSFNDTLTAPQNLVTSNIASTSFLLRWDSVNNATHYRVDVATDPNFTNILSSYNNRSVPTASSIALTTLPNILIGELEVDTLYYVRVRAQNTSQTSNNSSVVMQNTYLNRGEPVKNFFPPFFDGGGLPNRFGGMIKSISYDPINNHTYVAGDFRNINVTDKCEHLAKLLPDGRIDPTFSRFGSNNIIEHVHYSTGLNKIYIAGLFTKAAQTNRKFIARLNSNGTIDNTFVPPTGIFGSRIYKMHVFEDGSVIAVGNFTASGSANMVKLTPGGDIDLNFQRASLNTIATDIKAVKTPFEDFFGKTLIVAGTYRPAYNGLFRIFEDGRLDSTFTPTSNVGEGLDGVVNALAVSPSGDEPLIYMGGQFNEYLFRPFYPNLIQIANNGSIGNGRFNFRSSNRTGGINNLVYGLLPQEDNSVIAVGLMTSSESVFYPTYGPTKHGRIVALQANGDLDYQFHNNLTGTQADNSVFCINKHSGDNIIIGGFFYNYDNKVNDRICLINNKFNSSSSSSNNFITPSIPQNFNIYAAYGPWPMSYTPGGAMARGAVYLEWNYVQNATSYEIDVSNTPNFSSTNLVINSRKVRSNRFAFKDGVSNTTYYFRVRSVNIAGKSEYSIVLSARIPPSRPLSAPSVNGLTDTGITVFINNLELSTTHLRVDVSTDDFYSDFILQNQLYPVNGGLGNVRSTTITIPADFIPNNTTIYIRYRVQTSSNGLASENSFHGSYFYNIDPPTVSFESDAHFVQFSNHVEKPIFVTNGRVTSVTGLPAGLIWTESNTPPNQYNLIKGIPESFGSYNITITASNFKETVSITRTIRVIPLWSLDFVGNVIPDPVTVNQPYNGHLYSNGGWYPGLNPAPQSNVSYCSTCSPGQIPRRRYYMAGGPPGLSVNEDTGQITGTPTVIGEFYPVFGVVADYGNDLQPIGRSSQSRILVRSS